MIKRKHYFRVINKGGNFYVQKRVRFLFWTWWELLDTNGKRPWSLHYSAKQKYNAFCDACNAMEDFAKVYRDKKEGKKFSVCQTIEV